MDLDIEPATPIKKRYDSSAFALMSEMERLVLAENIITSSMEGGFVQVNGPATVHVTVCDDSNKPLRTSIHHINTTR